ncbi:MAG TPA: excinuclease ABC subunit UvrC [Polyangiaceae bacterium]|nr:excinuclease ABC subunit UvrC [Polyangiaceae bacterium]
MAADQVDETDGSGERDLPERVAQKLEGLPPSPGCYVFRDRKGAVLYVGKAKSLRSRVRSYFQQGSSDNRAFIPILLRAIGDLETIVTGTEKEAAILENSLIKEQKPRYNVKLRDDKEYLTLRLTMAHEWPRLELVRRAEGDKSRYFGPYHSATAARRTLHLVEKHFQLRTCSDRELVSRKRPCLQFQIKRCPAPCVFNVDHGLYGEQVRSVSLFLDGRHDELRRELEGRMADAATNFEYELAATYRDQIRAVDVVRQAQRVVAVTDRDQDVLGLYRQGDLVELSVLYVRSGRVVEAASFSHARTEIPEDELVAAFLREHYAEGGSGSALIPDEVLLPVLPEGAEGVEEWLSERRELAAREKGETARQVCLHAPARGWKRQLLELAMENAKHAFDEKRRAAEDMDERLARIQVKLRLPALPRRIECVDISHLGGEDTVGGVVALKDGVPDKSRYRTYKVRSAGPGDDYAAMLEVLSRRFARGRAAAEGAETDTWELPDLFLVDGGRGQLAVALTAAHDLGLHELSIAGLAKERENVAGEELVDRVYLPGQKNPISLRPNSPELYLLAMARDEAHRFANRGRKKVGKRRRFASRLDDVPGVGPKTRTTLLTALGSVDGIRRATDVEVLAVRGVSKRHLEALRKYLGREGEDQDDGVVEGVEEGSDDQSLSEGGAESASSVEGAPVDDVGEPVDVAPEGVEPARPLLDP